MHLHKEVANHLFRGSRRHFVGLPCVKSRRHPRVHGCLWPLKENPDDSPFFGETRFFLVGNEDNQGHGDFQTSRLASRHNPQAANRQNSASHCLVSFARLSFTFNHWKDIGLYWPSPFLLLKPILSFWVQARSLYKHAHKRLLHEIPLLNSSAGENLSACPSKVGAGLR